MRRALAAVLVLVLMIRFVRANTYFVTNNANGGAGSLRQAIVDANNHPGFDTIAFAIPGVSVHTITLTADLPVITDQVLIDGYTEPGSTPNTLANGDNAVLLIEVKGSSAVRDVFNVEAIGCTIRGLVINGATKVGGGRGISVGAGAIACVIEGCFIGTDPMGALAQPNSIGVELNIYPTNRVGGTTAAARNIISGNAETGIFIQGASNSFIQGNFIGVDASGTQPLPNGNGVEIAGNTNFIGGTTSSARNIISGNNLNGIILDFGASGNFIQGNFIGTDLTGTQAVSNGQHGIFLDEPQYGLGSNVFGGAQTGAGNVVSANGHLGIYIHRGHNSMVQGNFIGTDVSGSLALGNSRGGILIDNASNNTAIGGSAAGAGNIIAHNAPSRGEAGVAVLASTNTSILSNSIFDNGGLGIDLGNDGVTANDSGDSDTGANNLQNFPVITGFMNLGITFIYGRLNSAVNTTYRIEVFANDTIDPTGYGEGQIFLGAGSFTTDASGNVSFTITGFLPHLGAEERLTATATDPYGNTSEFSAAVGQLRGWPAPAHFGSGTDQRHCCRKSHR